MAALVVSADSHVMEPATLWTERLDRHLDDAGHPREPATQEDRRRVCSRRRAGNGGSREQDPPPPRNVGWIIPHG